MAGKHRYTYASPSDKSRTVALVLCAGLGFLGMHYFYVRRYWRAALNLFLLLALTIATRVYGLYYFKVYIRDTQMFFHWREALAVASAAALGASWIVDIVRIAQGKFRDSERRPLK